MNILADEQLKMMEAGLSEEEYARRREAFLSIYYRLRKREEGRWYSRLSLRQRQKLHPLILFVYRAKNRLGGFTHEVLGDLRSKTDRPIIFAVTHVGKFDIEVVSEAIRSHYYLLSGDYEHLQGIVDAPFLALNGVIYFNETVKEDRRSATDRMIVLLREGGNLMYFPEGTWNMTPNLPMIPCYWGIVDIAKQGGAMIVPVAAEQYGKHFKVNIGANFDINAYGDDVAEKSRAIKDLRDTLAALKYEIWETVPAKRSEIAPDEWEQYSILSEIVDQTCAQYAPDLPIADMYLIGKLIPAGDTNQSALDCFSTSLTHGIMILPKYLMEGKYQFAFCLCDKDGNSYEWRHAIMVVSNEDWTSVTP